MRRQGDLRRFLRTRQQPTRQVDPTAQASTIERPGHTPGAWPGGSGSGAPGARACGCPSCKSYAADQPPPEALLDVVAQSINPESA
jgi:hypothetical protein